VRQYGKLSWRQLGFLFVLNFSLLNVMYHSFKNTNFSCQ